jgi:hypothetical protein
MNILGCVVVSHLVSWVVNNCTHEDAMGIPPHLNAIEGIVTSMY